MNTIMANDFVRNDTNRACEIVEHLCRKRCIRYINENKLRNNRTIRVQLKYKHFKLHESNSFD